MVLLTMIVLLLMPRAMCKLNLHHFARSKGSVTGALFGFVLPQALQVVKLHLQLQEVATKHLGHDCELGSELDCWRGPHAQHHR